MDDILNTNINMFIKNLIDNFNIDKKELIRLKKKNKLSVDSVKKKLIVYKDIDGNKYVVPYKTDTAFQIIN